MRLTPTEAQLQRHDENHPEHQFLPTLRSTGRQGHLIRCLECVSYIPQERKHEINHPDHQPIWEQTEKGGRRCTICLWQAGRIVSGADPNPALYTPKPDLDPEDAAPLPADTADRPTVVHAHSPNGVTAGQLVAALLKHHPDDRIEVTAQDRRRRYGRRVDTLIVIPAARNEDAA